MRRVIDHEKTWQALSADAQYSLTHRKTEPVTDAVRSELMRAGVLDPGEPTKSNLATLFAEWVDKHHPATP